MFTITISTLAHESEDRAYWLGDPETVKTGEDSIKRLFRNCQREYGRCISKVYQEPDATQVGWVFQKREDYADAHRIRRGNPTTYLRETWITVYTVHTTNPFTQEN